MRKRNNLLKICILCMCLLVLWGLSYGDSEKSANESTPLKIKIDKDNYVSALKDKIPQIMSKAFIPGISIAVVREGKVFWSQAFGVKNAGTRQLVTQDTIFEAASLSKPVFAYGVLKLVDNGKLDLDKPLIHYVSKKYISKNFSEEIVKDKRIEKITARMILSHSCGFPNWRGKKLEFIFEPGSKFSYSGEGFVFLLQAIKKITGKSLNKFAKNYVFKPLGMKDSSYTWRSQYRNRAAFPHRYLKPGKIRPSKKGNPAASLTTTANDYARFLAAVLNGEGLKDRTFKEMLTPQVKTEKSASLSWGLGWGLYESTKGNAIWQWGDNGTFKAFCIGYPDKKMGLVYFANNFCGLTVLEEMLQLVLGGSYTPITTDYLSLKGPDSPRMQVIGVYLKKGISAAIQVIKGLLKNPQKRAVMTEENLDRLGSEIKEIQDYKSVISLYQFGLEQFPESFILHRGLGGAYLSKDDREQAKIYFKKALELNTNKNKKDNTIEWDLAYIEALEKPLKLSLEYLKKLEGDYQERHVRFKYGALYYFRGNSSNPHYSKLIPLSKDTFVIKGVIFFRMRFVFGKDSIPKKIIGIYNDGRQDQSIRN
jgi:CubicO group peptidase (beta-lactamase class C family)